MAGNPTNCAGIRERVFDAATGSLSATDRAAFDAHLGGCAACAKEFRRVQMLAQAIDHSMSASLAVEPSPQLIANVRWQTSAEPHRAIIWKQRSMWLTAAGVCAALALLVLTVRSAHKFNFPTQSHTAALIHSPSPAKSTVQPRLNAAVESATAAQPRKLALAPVHRLSASGVHRKSAGLEVIVQPGQMQAILRLVAATQSGQIDGAKLLTEQKKAAEPLEIKPLVIAPLKVAALDDGTAPASGKDESGDKDFVTGHLN